MTAPLTFHSRIIETLYAEALRLSDEVRQAFAGPFTASATPPVASPIAKSTLARRSWLDGAATGHDDHARIVFSSEGLRTTTRMMHTIAWLLNHRAFLKGEMSAFQLDRCSHLPPEKPEVAPEEAATLPRQTMALVERTRRFRDRIDRLDREWRRGAAPRPDLLEQLSSRLASQDAA